MTNERGASILEVLLAMAIVAMVMPFLYFQISEISQNVVDIRDANAIISLREPALNFVRLNQTNWPSVAQIKLDDSELKRISNDAHTGFIDRYDVRGAIMTDVYLAFNTGDAMRAANIAKQIGGDAALVNPDGVAYATSWAAAAPDFAPGDLVYRISYNFSGDDNSKYLHRATTGEDDFNVMMRPLLMNGFDVFNVGTIAAASARITDVSAAFAASELMSSDTIYFARGANMDGNSMDIGALRVSGDTIGFRGILAMQLNEKQFGTNGNIIADRVNVYENLHVANRMNIKSESTRNISDFVVIKAHSVATPFLSVGEIIFSDNFGLTVSGELLMSTNPPIRIGDWIFPSYTPPGFAELSLARAPIPNTPNPQEFELIMKDGWKDIRVLQ